MKIGITADCSSGVEYPTNNATRFFANDRKFTQR